MCPVVDGNIISNDMQRRCLPAQKEDKISVRSMMHGQKLNNRELMV